MEPVKNQPQPESSLHFLDYWRIIRIRRTVIISVFLLISITATLVTFILPRYYSSTASIEINPDTSESVSMPISTYLPYDPYFIQTEFEKMQSEKVLGRVISQLDLNNAWGKQYNNNVPLKTEQTLELLREHLNLAPERMTKLIDITVLSEDPDQAAQIANAVAEAYHEYRLAVHNTNMMQDVQMMEDNYQQEEKSIEAVQTNVDSLRQELGIIDTDPNAISPSPTLTQEQMQQKMTDRDLDEQNYMKMDVVLKQLQTIQETNPIELQDVLPTINPDATLSDLLTKLHSTEQAYASEIVSYTTNLPDIKSLQSVNAELKSEVSARVTGIMAGLAAQVASYQATADNITAELENAKSNDLAEITRGQPYWEEKRKLESMEEFHKLVGAKIDSEKLDLDAPKSQMVQLVNSAVPGKDPVKPNKALNIILGLVIGLIVGIGLAFFIEYLDTSVKTIDDVERALQAPVLGVIPQNVGYLIDEGVESQHAEAYRVLRTNLLFSRKDDKLNTIVVVSAGAGEGKSTTALNLATVFAQAGQRVLIVDSDLRRPTLHKLLHVSNASGVTNYLLKQNAIEEVIQRTSVPTLDVMASGKLPSSSMNILGSAQMKEMIAELKHRYDYVFFDSPPIMGVSDAAVLASEVDMVVQVIQYRRYPQPMNIRAKQMIEKVGGNLIGIVLNNINMSQDESYYYYSGYYHGYYYYSKNEQEQEAEAAAKTAGGDTDRGGIKQKY
ncbi:MAG TPA: polysaccharide biosynthesis tyrosine autokinase [Verrucomicrobiae bacterium]|jgi:capsular exopolysaccharide synthesis family protein